MKSETPGIRGEAVIGEYGIDNVLGGHNWRELSKTLLQSPLANEISRIYKGRELHALNDQERDGVAREVLSHLAENDHVSPSLARRAWDFVRNILRKLGITHAYTDSDISYIVRQARGFLSEPTPLDESPSKSAPEGGASPLRA